MKRWLALFLTMFMLPFSVFAADSEKEADRVQEAGTVLKEILDIPDDIPKDLVDKAECVIVLPSVKKAAFGVGISYGRGVMTCRSGQHYTGLWTAPALYALEGGNIGFQLGGLFAGVSLEGSTLRSDNRANKKLYGREVTAKEILREGKVGTPASAHQLIALLNKYSPKNKSDPKSLE
jgi:lipid-binding SYLF domain-containing protein